MCGEGRVMVAPREGRNFKREKGGDASVYTIFLLEPLFSVAVTAWDDLVLPAVTLFSCLIGSVARVQGLSEGRKGMQELKFTKNFKVWVVQSPSLALVNARVPFVSFGKIQSMKSLFHIRGVVSGVDGDESADGKTFLSVSVCEGSVGVEIRLWDDLADVPLARGCAIECLGFRWNAKYGNVCNVDGSVLNIVGEGRKLPASITFI